MRAWDILRGGAVVDTVFFDECMGREDVEQALEHDGYVPGTFTVHAAELQRGRRWDRTGRRA